MLPGVGVAMGIDCNRQKGTFKGNGKVLTLNYSDGCATGKMHWKLIKLYTKSVRLDTKLSPRGISRYGDYEGLSP